MTDDEMIELMARAIWPEDFGPAFDGANDDFASQEFRAFRQEEVDEMLADGRAALSALRSAGMAVVPREPTAKMFAAGQRVVSLMDKGAVKTVDWEQVYRAMIKTAEGTQE